MSLEERVEMPSIPKDVARKIARVEEEFTRAEVEQRMYPTSHAGSPSNATED